MASVHIVRPLSPITSFDISSSRTTHEAMFKECIELLCQLKHQK